MLEFWDLWSSVSWFQMIESQHRWGGRKTDIEGKLPSTFLCIAIICFDGSQSLKVNYMYILILGKSREKLWWAETGLKAGTLRYPRHSTRRMKRGLGDWFCLPFCSYFSLLLPWKPKTRDLSLSTQATELSSRFSNIVYRRCLCHALWLVPRNMADKIKFSFLLNFIFWTIGV